MPQQRAYQVALDQDVIEQPRQQPNAAKQSQQQAWAPRRSLPPPAYYGVQVIIRAHELKFVKLASTVVRDLALVNFAPKSREAAPTSRRRNVPWVTLAMPIGDTALPTRRTHFTVIRGPHVHKTSREQFARITHQRLIQYSTNNVSELHWFLHSLKMYKFIGVEMMIRVSSSSYLLPTTSEQQAAAEQPLLQQHKQRFAHLFGASAPSSYSNSQQLLQQDSSRSSSYAALQQSMQGLRESVQQGLLHQRVQLAENTNFKRWQDGRRNANAAAPSTASSVSAQVIADLVAQQVQGSNMVDSIDYEKQHAFLAAVDKTLVSLKLNVLDRHKYFPYLMAFYKLGQQKTPPAEWMHAMLKYGKMRQQEVDSSQTAVALEGYQQYGQVAHTLLLQMLQQWYQSVDSQGRKELGLPDAEMVDDMMGSAGLGRVRSAASAVAAGAGRRAGSRPTSTAAEKGHDKTEGDTELEASEDFLEDVGDDASSLPDLESDLDSGRHSRGSFERSKFDRSKFDRYTAGGGGVDRYTGAGGVDRYTPKADE